MYCGRHPHLPKLCAQSDPPSSENTDFDSFRLIVPQPWELAKIAIIDNRKSTTRFPTSHRWTLYVTPKSLKGWHKNAISLFVPVKFNFCRKKSATKFLCIKTSSGKVVATSFPYPTVAYALFLFFINDRLRATSPSTWNWRSKWRTPSENVDFQSFRFVALRQ